MLLIISAIIILVLITTLGKGFPGFLLGLWVCAAIGWVANIVTLINGPAVALWAGLEVARVVGVLFAPLGAVLGYF